MKPLALKPLEEYCLVCQRVRWGNWQPLAWGKWRHAECAPGTTNWREAYLRGERRSPVGDILAGIE